MLIKVIDVYIRTEDIISISDLKGFGDTPDFVITVGNYGAKKDIPVIYNSNHAFAKRKGIKHFHPSMFSYSESASDLKKEYHDYLNDLKDEAKQYIEGLHKQILDLWSNTKKEVC